MNFESFQVNLECLDTIFSYKVLKNIYIFLDEILELFKKNYNKFSNSHKII